MKNEINKVLDQLSDKTLADLLSFVKDIKSKNLVTFSDSVILEKILTEDRELLEKLAKWYP